MRKAAAKVRRIRQLTKKNDHYFAFSIRKKSFSTLVSKKMINFAGKTD